MLLWGVLYSFVKLGYTQFGLRTAFVPDLLLFAGLRFLLAGTGEFVVCRVRKIPLIPSRKSDFFPIALVELFSVILHYSCSYISLSYIDSGKMALLKQSAVLLFVCLSFIFIRDDRFKES